MWVIGEKTPYIRLAAVTVDNTTPQSTMSTYRSEYRRISGAQSHVSFVEIEKIIVLEAVLIDLFNVFKGGTY